MSTKFKTIDDLGTDPSIRYAIDQHYYEAELIKETPLILQQTQIEVAFPAYPSEFEALFGLKSQPQEWAAFLAPPGFSDQKKRLFTFQLMPSLGSEELSQLYPLRIQEKIQRDQERKKKNSSTFEDDIDFQEELKESKKLLDLLAIIAILDKILADILAQKGRYHKG